MTLVRINISIPRWYIVYNNGTTRTNINDSIVECFKDINSGIAINYNGREYNYIYSIEFENLEDLINKIPEEFL